MPTRFRRQTSGKLRRVITRAKPAKGADDEGDRTEFIQLAKSVKLLAAIHSLPDHDAI